MANKLTDDCISYGACEPECGNDAICVGEEIYVIDADRCTECVGNFESPKCAEVCPVDACVSDPAHEGSKVKAGFVTERIISTLFQRPDVVHHVEEPKEGYFPNAGFTIIVGAKHDSEM